MRATAPTDGTGFIPHRAMVAVDFHIDDSGIWIKSAEPLAQKDIDGGLIGGASLESRSFIDLVKSAVAAG